MGLFNFSSDILKELVTRIFKRIGPVTVSVINLHSLQKKVIS